MILNNSTCSNHSLLFHRLSSVKTRLRVGALDSWLENKLTASAADRRTAPAVTVTLDLLTLDGLFKGFDAATDLVGFGYSTFIGQDVCDLFLKFDG